MMCGVLAAAFAYQNNHEQLASLCIFFCVFSAYTYAVMMFLSMTSWNHHKRYLEDNGLMDDYNKWFRKYEEKTE